MLRLALKSALLGVITLVVGALVGLFLSMVGLWIYAAFFFRPPAESGGSGTVQVGWDVVTLFKSYETPILIAFFLLFAAGFLFGFRRFAKSEG